MLGIEDFCANRRHDASERRVAAVANLMQILQTLEGIILMLLQPLAFRRTSLVFQAAARLAKPRPELRVEGL